MLYDVIRERLHEAVSYFAMLVVVRVRTYFHPPACDYVV